jgi:hypothetical protein
MAARMNCFVAEAIPPIPHGGATSSGSGRTTTVHRGAGSFSRTPPCHAQTESAGPSSSQQRGKGPATPRASDEEAQDSDEDEGPGYADQFVMSQLSGAPPYTQTQGEPSQVCKF